MVTLSVSSLWTRPAPRTGLAGIADDLTCAAARGTCPLDREEALLGAHLAIARTAAAGRCRIGIVGAGTAAGAAGNGGRHANVRPLAGERLLESDLHVVSEIGTLHAGTGAAATAAAAHEIAEEIVEDIGKTVGEIVPVGTTHAAVECRMPEAVVCRALLLVLENLVGFVDLLELDLGRRIIRVAVGVVLHRQLAIGLLDGGPVRIPVDAEHVIEVGIGHGRRATKRCLAAFSPCRSSCRRRPPRSRRRPHRHRRRHCSRRLPSPAVPCRSPRQVS